MTKTVSMVKKIVADVIPLLAGSIMMLFIIYNLFVQYQIVLEARRHILTMNPADPDYYFYLHYSNFRRVTIFRSLFFGGIALYLIWCGYHNLKDS